MKRVPRAKAAAHHAADNAVLVVLVVAAIVVPVAVTEDAVLVAAEAVDRAAVVVAAAKAAVADVTAFPTKIIEIQHANRANRAGNNRSGSCKCPCNRRALAGRPARFWPHSAVRRNYGNDFPKAPKRNEAHRTAQNQRRKA